MASRYFNPYRLASYLLVLYTLGHTLGAVVGTPHFGPESDRVVESMKSVHVVVQGSDATWYGFYRGFGMTISLFFIFSAAMTWYLGGLNPRERRVLAPLTWIFLLTWIANTVVAFAYFFPGPQVFSTAITILIAIVCIRDRAAFTSASERRDEGVTRHG